MLMMRSNFTLYALYNTFPYSERSDQQFAIGALTRRSGQEIKYCRGISSDLWSTGEQAEIFIYTSSSSVIISSAQMYIAMQTISLLTHHRRGLGMCLQVFQPM